MTNDLYSLPLVRTPMEPYLKSAPEGWSRLFSRSLHFLFFGLDKLFLDDVGAIYDRVLEGLGISLYHDAPSRNAYLDLDILVVVVRKQGKGHVNSAYGIIESLEF